LFAIIDVKISITKGKKLRVSEQVKEIAPEECPDKPEVVEVPLINNKVNHKKHSDQV